MRNKSETKNNSNLFKHTNNESKYAQDTRKWQKGVPDVTVKANYRTIEPPKANGEDGVLRPTWPMILDQDKVNIPNLKWYLGDHLARGDDPVYKFSLGAGRSIFFFLFLINI